VIGREERVLGRAQTMRCNLESRYRGSGSGSKSKRVIPRSIHYRSLWAEKSASLVANSLHHASQIRKSSAKAGMEVWWYSLLLKSLLWIALELKGSGQLIGFHILRRDIDAKDISVQVSLHLHKHPAEAGQAGCGVAF
jgi:hypothetical protein